MPLLDGSSQRSGDPNQESKINRVIYMENSINDHILKHMITNMFYDDITIIYSF